tara:strand:+ start:12939 stop:13148 length:210 start_codon:yes stop_codon:yes gene_type:complete
MQFPNCANTSAQMTHGFQNGTYGQQPVDQLKEQQAVAQNAAAKQAPVIQQIIGMWVLRCFCRDLFLVRN